MFVQFKDKSATLVDLPVMKTMLYMVFQLYHDGYSVPVTKKIRFLGEEISPICHSNYTGK